MAEECSGRLPVTLYLFCVQHYLALRYSLVLCTVLYLVLIECILSYVSVQGFAIVFMCF